MMTEHENWIAAGASVIGSSHVRKQMPNQDAYSYKDLGRDIQVLALSDGHGGALHKYSDIGSQTAVAVSIDVLEDYVKLANLDHIDQIVFELETQISQQIQQTWRDRIEKDPNFEQYIHYGCTLLIALKTKEAIYFLQIGDGKCAIVYNDGIVYYPMPKDDRFNTNETLSLSQLNAWAEMKVVAVDMSQNIQLIALTSDGVENAYPEDYYDDAHFFLNLAYGESVQDTMNTMVEAAMLYSKDDTTAVVMKNVETEMISRDLYEDIHIWRGEYPIDFLPLAHKTELGLNKRLELAIQLTKAIIRKNRVVPEYLSIKQIYVEIQTGELHFLETGKQTLMTKAGLENLVETFLGVPVAYSAVTQSFELDFLNALMALQLNLRYDYLENQFYFSDEAHYFAFESSRGIYELFYNSDLYASQILPLTIMDDKIIGSVVQHEKYREIWGLKNKSSHAWEIYDSSGKMDIIYPGKTFTLKNGVTVFIYGVPIKIILVQNRAQS